MNKERFVTISLTVLCQSFQAVSIGGIALFLPLIRRDLGLTFTQAGSLAAALVDLDPARFDGVRGAALRVALGHDLLMTDSSCLCC